MEYEPEPCGHHCDDDCPRCGANRPRRPKRTRRPKNRRWCQCEGAEHDHGCPNGM